MFLWMTFLIGIAYPFLVATFAHVTVKEKALGSLVFNQEKVIGSIMIGQKFEDDGYFWPRPSAIDYNPLPSGGSNLGPINAKLKQIVAERKARLIKAHGTTEVPSELLYASGSGLDPHLSPQAAAYQITRISKARGIDPERIQELIDRHIYWRVLGFLGENCVNVLELNLALDEIR